MADGLLDPGHQQLVDGALGTVVDAVEALGEPPAHVALEHVGLDDRPRQLARCLGVEPLRVLAYDGGELLGGLAVAAGEAAARAAPARG